jgi:hypothetical protein
MASFTATARLEAIGWLDDGLVGREGVIDNAWSPHYGEAVVVVGADEDTLTVVPKDSKRFTFARAELPRNSVRLL